MIRYLFRIAICCSVFATTLPGRAQDRKTTADELFHSFNQSNEGNSVSVAYIKAAIFVFDLQGVFRVDSVNGGRYFITLQNGQSLELSNEELVAALASAAFSCDTTNKRYKEIDEYAVLCYAVMAKVRQGLENIGSYKEALEKMASGADSRSAWKYLGLTPDEVKGPKYWSSVRGSGSLVMWRAKHAAFACYGKINLKQGSRKINLWRWLIYHGRMRLTTTPAAQPPV